MLKIGNIRIKSPFFLSPMVDVTNLPYQIICRKAGAALTYSEMIYASAILHENEKTKKMMMRVGLKPSAIQITGNDLIEFKKLVPYLSKYDIIDINCGCPSSRIIGNQAGSFLLKTPEKIVSFIKILKEPGYTVTAKIRLGYDKNNSIQIAKKIENAGADALTIHPRLATQGYNIPADWSQIKKVKENISIPLIGNGDITSPQKALQMLSIADAAMIGRAAIGDPHIFTRILKYKKTGKEIEPDFMKNIGYFSDYLKLSKKYKVEDLKQIKFVGANFIKGINGAAKLRSELMLFKTIDEIQDFLKQKLL